MDVGSTLHAARVARGLYIPELVYRTRIRTDIIVAIEANDFSLCGGDVFARGHVRALAVALGIDPEPLIEQMGASTAASSVAAVEPETLSIWELHERAKAPSERRVWGVLAAIAVIIIGFLIWQHRASGSEQTLDAATLPSVTTSATAMVTAEPTPTATAAATETAAPSATATAEPTATATETASTVLDGALVLQLTCTQTSWVRITNARGSLYEGTMHRGDTRSLSSDTDTVVRIGNAAGVQLVVNGTDVGALGTLGEVYQHTFTVA